MEADSYDEKVQRAVVRLRFSARTTPPLAAQQSPPRSLARTRNKPGATWHIWQMTLRAAHEIQSDTWRRFHLVAAFYISLKCSCVCVRACQELEQQFERERHTLEEQRSALLQQLEQLREEMSSKLDAADHEVNRNYRFSSLGLDIKQG